MLRATSRLIPGAGQLCSLDSEATASKLGVPLIMKMKIVKELAELECYYDNAVTGMPTLTKIDLNDDSVIVDFRAIIGTQFTGGNVPEKVEDLMEILHLGEFSSAPNGGFINFYSAQSRNHENYILFSGVNEVSNSHYIVTVHKVLQSNLT